MLILLFLTFLAKKMKKIIKKSQFSTETPNPLFIYNLCRKAKFIYNL